VKILRVITRLNIGGPARHVVLLDRGLRARGHETHLVYGSLAPGDASLEHLAVAAGLPATHVRALGRRINPVSDLRAFTRLLRMVFREAPDVIHTHTAKAGTLGRVAAGLFNMTRPRRRRCLVVHTFHGHVLSGYFGPTMNLAVRLAERTLAGITDRVVTLSPAQRHDIVTRFNIAAAARTAVVPLGLDLERLASLDSSAAHLRRQFGIPERATVVGFAGRFVAIKDLATLVRAFSLVAARRPEAVLLLVGDGPLRPEIAALVAALALQKQVHLAGWVDDLAPVYATMDVFALSSLNEGTPVAVIEAMAAAKAVVATRVGGVADVVEHERTGLLVSPQNPEALADSIVRLAADPGERSRLGAAGRQSVVARFSPERLADDIVQLYTSALAEKRSPRAPAPKGAVRV
jgi:glycosyltransferase involved in cell wall biosynthesis